MKRMTLSMTILFAAFLISCGGKDKKEGDNNEGETKMEVTTDNGPASKLEGAWEIKRAIGSSGSIDSLNIGTVYEFKGSKLSFGKGSYLNPGSTTVTDSTFSFQADGNELKFMYNYKFNGDTLVVEMQNSGGQTFYMTKK